MEGIRSFFAALAVFAIILAVLMVLVAWLLDLFPVLISFSSATAVVIALWAGWRCLTRVGAPFERGAQKVLTAGSTTYVDGVLVLGLAAMTPVVPWWTAEPAVAMIITMVTAAPMLALACLAVESLTWRWELRHPPSTPATSHMYD